MGVFLRNCVMALAQRTLKIQGAKMVGGFVVQNRFMMTSTGCRSDCGSFSVSIQVGVSKT